MTIVIGLALVALGLAIGFIVTWSFGVGVSLSLSIGLLLVVAGAIVGFVTEWLIDEAYRRNRELRRLLIQRGDTALTLGIGIDEGSGDFASKTMADFVQRREQEAQELRGQLSAMDSQFDSLRDEFEAYQQTHPDDLTVIKGVGSVYQWKLRDAGVNTHKQLAESDADQLRRMLDIKTWQRVDVESWIEQARDWAQRES
jgi:predicted flap endonuclease-1-like 5' DNA nuclease